MNNSSIIPYENFLRVFIIAIFALIQFSDTFAQIDTATAISSDVPSSLNSPLATGGLDPGFAATIGLTGGINAVALQSDGKAVIVGNFRFVETSYRNHVARLNVDGSVDQAFNPGVGPNNSVLDVGVQPDGKVVIVGQFTQVSGVPRGGIARLNADGTVDAQFAPAGSNGTIQTVALDPRPGGKILIGGVFSLYNGVSRLRVARLLSNGDLDLTYITPSTSSTVNKILIQPDNKVLVGGSFVFGTSGIMRTNDNGSIDTSFTPNINPSVGIAAIALAPNGQILVGGSAFGRLNSNGSVDTSFVPVVNNVVGDIAVRSNGQIIIGGLFTMVNGVPRTGLASFNTNGSLDGFNPVLSKTTL